jgi:hypothetical protein
MVIFIFATENQNSYSDMFWMHFVSAVKVLSHCVFSFSSLIIQAVREVVCAEEVNTVQMYELKSSWDGVSVAPFPNINVATLFELSKGRNYRIRHWVQVADSYVVKWLCIDCRGDYHWLVLVWLSAGFIPTSLPIPFADTRYLFITRKTEIAKILFYIAY